MAVLDDHPGISVVVRLHGGEAIKEDPCPLRKQAKQPDVPPTMASIQSFDDAEFSVAFTVDDTYDFSRGCDIAGSGDHCLRFQVKLDGGLLRAECDIGRQDVAAGHGLARGSVDRAMTAYDRKSGLGFTHKFRFPIMEKGGYSWSSSLLAIAFPLDPSATDWYGTEPQKWTVRGRRRPPGIMPSTTGERGLIEVSVSRVPLGNEPGSIRSLVSFLERGVQDVDKAKKLDGMTKAEK